MRKENHETHRARIFQLDPRIQTFAAEDVHALQFHGVYQLLKGFLADATRGVARRGQRRQKTVHKLDGDLGDSSGDVGVEVERACNAAPTHLCGLFD
jgi:hypothetical protein